MRKEKVYFISDDLKIKHEEVNIRWDNFAFYSSKIKTGVLIICFAPDEWSRDRLVVEKLLDIIKRNKIKRLEDAICRSYETIEEIKKYIEKISVEIDNLKNSLK
jgi:hypothetical protein